MFTVAFIGPDGTGKTTIARKLEASLLIPAKYLYMGFAPDSSNIMLPTTRLVYALKRKLGIKPSVSKLPVSNDEKPKNKGIVKRIKRKFRSNLRMVNWLIEECFRFLLAFYYNRRGYVVLFDRHFFFDSPVLNVLDLHFHRFLLKKVYPKPDLVIYLDAPGEVLFKRKGEESIEKLERLRKNYLQLCHQTEHFVKVDATQSEIETTRDVADHIMNFYKSRLGKR